MSTKTSPFLRKNGVIMLIFIWNFQMSNNNSPITKTFHRLSRSGSYTTKFLTKHHISK